MTEARGCPVCEAGGYAGCSACSPCQPPAAPCALDRLLQAAEQVLDDMQDGTSCCPAARDALRDALVPFRARLAEIDGVPLPAAPCADEVEVVAPEVERIEMVSYENDLMCGEPADPIWRITLNGYCADFPSEGAARNFAAQIAALAALSPLRQAERERAWREGAEAMREACAAVVLAADDAAMIRAQPLPPPPAQGGQKP